MVSATTLSLLGGRFGNFLYFLLLGEGTGESEAKGLGGVGSSLKIPGGGGFPGRAERPGGCLRRTGEFGGGGV